jgi:hypothetical protein
MLLAHADGPVLDLGGAVSPIASDDWGTSRNVETRVLGHEGDPTAALAALVEREEPGRYAEVLSTMVSPHVADLAGLLRAVAAVLDGEGRLLFVEPDAVAGGWSGLAAPALRSLAGLELGRDITGAMWNSGFSVTSIERRPLSISAWPFRNLVSGVARLTEGEPDSSRRN